MLSRKMLFHQGLSAAPVKTSAEDVRMNFGALWTPEGPNGDSIKVRQGVVAGAGYNVNFLPCDVVAGTGQVTVKPGRVVVQGTAANQGSYVGTIDQDEVRTIAGAKVGAGLPSAGQFKAGRVLIRIYDQLYDGGSVDGWDVEIHLGASAASAAAAILPPTVASSFVLRTFTVNSAGAFTMGGAPPYTVPRGGILPVPIGDTTAGSYDGQYRDVAGVGLQRWSAIYNFWDSVGPWQVPILRLRASQQQPIATDTWTSLHYNIEDWDTHGMFTTGADNAIICRRSGWYWCSAHWAPSQVVSGRRIINFWKNGSLEAGGIAVESTGSNSEVGPETNTLIYMDPGDLLQVYAFHSAAGTVTVSNASYAMASVSVFYVRP